MQTPWFGEREDGPIEQPLPDTGHDPITRLPGRPALERRLKEAAGRRAAVVCIDLPRLKGINTTLGRPAGDALLRQVAGRLAAHLRPGDTLARLGGGEFGVVLGGIDSAGAAFDEARRIRDFFQTPFEIGGQEIFLAARVGLSVSPDDGRDSASLLRNAGAAAAFSSQDVARFTEAIGIATFGRLRLEGDLWRALAESQFQLLYQPQVDLDGRLEMLEALLSWDHPQLGRIQPALFIPIAEECGMIVPIGEWVLRQACRQNAAWHKRCNAPVPVSVNVSVHEFSRPDFVASVERAIADTGLAPSRLMLEITESVVIPDLDRAVARMADLRALGVLLAIDDFGAGYSSLGYLRRLPVDVLKIDRSFLLGTDSATDASPLIATIVRLAHDMGLKVVAEGVEDEHQWEALRAAGCDRLQGHLFGRPAPTAKIERRLLGAA